MNVARRPVPLSDVKKRGLYAGGDNGGNASSASSSSATDVDMYLDVPSFELSLDEFEEYALARLKVCHIPLSCIHDFVMVWCSVAISTGARGTILTSSDRWCMSMFLVHHDVSPEPKT